MIPEDAATGYIALATIIGVAAAEYVTAFLSAPVGVGIHVLLLTFFLAAGASTQGDTRAFFLMISVAPLIRIVSLGMPLDRVPQPFWYVLTAVPILGATGVIAMNLGLRPGRLGLRLPPRGYLWMELVVALSGIGLGVVEWRILDVRPMVNGRSVGWIVAGAIILLIFTGFFEELVFRGLMQRVAGNYLGIWPGIIFTAVIFSALHIGWHSIFDLLFVAGVAVYFSLVVRATGSLLGVAFAHGGINIMLFIGMPLLLVPSSLGLMAASPGIGHSAVAHSLPSSSKVRLTWRSSPLTHKYQVQVITTNALHVPRRDFTKPSFQRTTGANHLTFSVLGPQRYFWRVRSSFLGEWLPFSRIRHFAVAPPPVAAPQGLRVGFGRRTKDGVHTKLCWNTVSGVHAYLLSGSGTRSVQTTSTCIHRKLAAGAYIWSVASVEKAAVVYVGQPSPTMRFWIRHSKTGFSFPQQTELRPGTPTGIKVSRMVGKKAGKVRVRVCWSPLAGVSRYRVKLRPAGSATTKQACYATRVGVGVEKLRIKPLVGRHSGMPHHRSQAVFFRVGKHHFGLMPHRKVASTTPA